MINFNVFAGMTLAFEKRLQKKVEFFLKNTVTFFVNLLSKRNNDYY